MELNSAKPAANEVASVTAAVSEQAGRFNDRKAIEAQSQVKTEAVFFSPVIKIDAETHSTVIQYRDSTTGKVERQYPDTVKVGAYEHAQDTAPSEPAPAPKEAAPVSKDNGNIQIISDKQADVKAADVKAPDNNQSKEPSVDEQA